jgi:hypothetical protein
MAFLFAAHILSGIFLGNFVIIDGLVKSPK